MDSADKLHSALPDSAHTARSISVAQYVLYRSMCVAPLLSFSPSTVCRNTMHART